MTIQYEISYVDKNKHKITVRETSKEAAVNLRTRLRELGYKKIDSRKVTIEYNKTQTIARAF